MVEQYTKILHPTEDQLARLKNGAADRWQSLEECRKRGEWEKVRKDKEQQKREEAEREAQAFAEIDWQDFAVVQNIEFTTADQTIELPPPTSIDALRAMGLNEKRMAALIVEQTGGDQSEHADGRAPSPAPVEGNGEMDVEMDEESEDEEAKAQREREAEELARAREVQAKAMGQAGMRIRKDYQSKGTLSTVGSARSPNYADCHLLYDCLHYRSCGAAGWQSQGRYGHLPLLQTVYS
jgi:splicing factor 3A subunit 1